MTILGTAIYQIAEFFLIYSFLGWCVEVIYAAFKTRQVVNRGFLNGPICPIYGFGVIAVFGLFGFSASREMMFDFADTIMLFIGGVILSTPIELIGGYVLDKLFHTRWWDYSDKKFNFHGYICLRFSILWGIGIVLIVKVIHPMISNTAVNVLPEQIGWVVIGVLYAAFLVDFVVSVMIMVGLNRQIAELDQLRQNMRVVSDELSTRLGEGALETAGIIDEARLQAALGRKEIEQDLVDRHEEGKRKVADARTNLRKRVEAHSLFGTGRVLRAFPNMENHRNPELLDELKDILNI